ncbi:MAG: glutathione S-transferase C-terminal domain-containing protein, partial [Proteobacteria bacterium]|nr:glutathione S-transferase C-terminal domain-containing protein [Pseudomonadota bacterium]
MGQLIDGVWNTEWYKPDEKGRFVRSETSFRDRISSDGTTPFAPEAGRYHLYVSLACPWAHRTLIMRRLKGLEKAISLSVVDAHMTDDGWHFSSEPGTIPDTVNNCNFMREIYTMADSHYSGRVTVPVLWDKINSTIVNNQSLEVMRILDTEFNEIAEKNVSFYPEKSAEEIDATIEAIYEPVNNGVYKAGFATTQEAYDSAVAELFSALDHWERVLCGRRYLCGETVTEADWCLFTTLVRFDVVYYTHFKCNKKHIYEYPNLWNYLKELYQIPGV